MIDYGCQLMAEKMTRVLMRRPADSLRNADPQQWHYNHLFDAEKAISQYEGLVGLIQETGAEIIWMDDNNDGLSDAMFTRDASLITKAGAVLLRMGKALRSAEPELHGRTYEVNGIPVLGALTGDALVEGGDTIWLDENTLIVGLGFRSNREGVRQLNEMLNPHGIKVLSFDLPVWSGEEACLHLMSVISPLTETRYLVHPPLIPAPLWTLMKERGIELIQAPADEFEASFGLNLNVLPLSPGNCVMIDGFPKTKAVMEEHGINVSVFEGDALCMACEGGPTCLTNPVLRG
ncbi:dimethylarginine dimethylaminohydrolase family protein [Oceanospirillum sediminis]|uniref:arginine deiminase n=1 Tax=Oceanospirillum sediminis TaxID=2760088 RepID=A0A839IR09_9GAMM|nr:arginine deiminase family protein [Oceanospirillum sediminis]MBB1487140.1 amidinotransferase [Oceanospirillum sediminis]